MSYLKNTLNFASYSYDASTDTPALAKMKDGTVFEVATAGKVVGTAISGCTLGADSYLLVGDKVVYKNGGHELISPKIKNGTTINVGTGGLFTTFKDANDYISQRVYTGVILNLLSATVETSSIDVQNPCGGRLVIMGNGFTIDFSGTANTNCTLSGDNIYIDAFKVKANDADTALFITGKVTYDNVLSVQNIHATGGALINANKLCGAYNELLAVNPTATLTLLVSVVSNYCFQSWRGAHGGYSGITCNGAFYGGVSCSNTFHGAIDTGGGMFSGGVSCSNYFAGAITTGGGQFSGGDTCKNRFNSTISVGAGNFDCGADSCHTFIGAVTGTGQFHYGTSCLISSRGGITGFTSVIATGGSSVDAFGTALPVGTPAVGTITAAFRRAT